MRILSLSNKLPYPPRDGGAIGFLNPLLGLAGAGNQVNLLAMNTRKHFFPVEDIPATIRDKIKIKAVFVNTDLNPFKAVKNLIFSKLPYNAERFINREYENALIALLQNEQFDVIQVEGLFTSPYISIIRKYSKALISYRSHNIEHEIWERLIKQEKNLFKRWYFSILTKRLKTMELGIVNQYDVLVPVTARDGEAFNRFGNSKPVHVTLPGWVLPDHKKNTNDSESDSVFHLGALDWFPNQEGILWFLKECWPQIHEKNPAIKFLIAGRNAPQWLIQKLHGNGVEFIGEVEDSMEFIRQHGVMVVPLLSGSGIRIKIIEGMAAAKSIVTTSIGIEGIYAEHGIHVMICDKPEDFINAVDSLVNNQDKLQEMGKQAFAFASEHFELGNISRQLTNFFEIQSQTNYKKCS